MKIAVCVPHHGDVKARFAKSLADLVARTMGTDIVYNEAPVRPRILTLFDERGTLELKRTALVKAARQAGADYVLWIDSDQTFPPDGLLRLMQHDRPVVGCNYMSRDGSGPTALGIDAEPVATGPSASGLERVAALGLGFCLVKTPVFDVIEERLPEAKFFVTELENDGNVVRGEDVHFFNQVRLAGFPVFLDHDLSREIGHVAEIVRMLGDPPADPGASG